MSKIKDLINFRKIKEVVDIDALHDKQKMVENYVISKSMEDNLVHLLKYMPNDTHKAAQIIGNYGSGKSHLLAFIISILTEKELRKYIKNENVRKAADQLNREFVVINWELQPNDVSLAEYFYDSIELQLEEKYGIKYSFPPIEGAVDHKKNIMDVLQAVKEEDSSRELVVIVDEISDFLKQKTKEKITRDVQFLRVIGQVAQENDFMFIGAMQEHIFTNPKYVDEADSIGRVAERFQIITISREDIKKVIANRVLHKTREQRIELENLFSGYIKHYPDIQQNLDEYIDLFPLHPYVIQIFSELPYFEKRGIIQFTLQEVEKILDKEFPGLITYDLIYDEIESKHTVKNLEMVSPIIEAIHTLDSKIDLLEEQDQNLARSIIKALSILKLYGKSINNGATAEELAITMLIIPKKEKWDAVDEISLVLSRLRKVTDGQFINKNEDNYYYLDLALNVDYDQVIERKTENLPENALDDEIFIILKDQLRLDNEVESGVFHNTCNWKSRKSFREGQFIYETGKRDIITADGDYQIIFISPLCSIKRYSAASDRMVVSGKLSSELIESLRRVAAAKALINDNYQRSIIQKKYVQLKKDFTREFVASYLLNGTVEIDTDKKSITSLISREFSNFDEMFTDIKPELFDSYFTKGYPKHPKFSQAITKDNIIGEFSTAINNLISHSGTQITLFGNTKSILNALNLLDDGGHFSTSTSEVVRSIMEAAKEQTGKNLDVDKFISKFEQAPYGYDPVMTEFVLVALTYNGEIALKAAGGKTITSSEVADVFKSGIEAFENIKYLTLESEFNIQPVINLFTAIGVDESTAKKLRVSSKRGGAIQDFRSRYLKIREDLEYVQNKLGILSLQQSSVVDIDGLKEKHDMVTNIPITDFEKVKTPTDLKKIIYKDAEIKSIAESVEMLHKLYSFYETYFKRIEPDVEYAIKVKDILDAHPDVFAVDDIEQFMDDSFDILGDANKLLSPDEFNPLLGKLQMVKRKYQTAYFNTHEQYVGDKVDWTRLSSIIDSLDYQKLKVLKNVQLLDKNRFMRIENDISSLRNLQCPLFRVELLDKNVICPKCSFPSGIKEVNVDYMIAAMEADIKKIYEDWEATILSELKNYRDNIQYLTPDEKQLIEPLILESGLPPSISEKLVMALNNLFKELESIELDPEEFIREIFSESGVMDYATFSKKLDEFKQKLVAGKDLDKIRIKFVQNGD
jgi:ABC-type cobalamin/Fe3+-siderophores transport system ATPase subunit